jgi:hypothetical protein
VPKADHRGSLMNLRTSLPKVAPIQTSEEMESQILGPVNEGTARPESIGSENVSPNRGTDVEPLSAMDRGPALPSRRREGTVLLNAKIPVSIHTRLKRTAQYNDVSMTDILLRGIEHELNSGRYSQPPSTWGLAEN